MMKIAILISGRGSNMSAILNTIKTKNLDCRVVCVISNKKQEGLLIASKYNVPAKLLDESKFNKKESHELAVADELFRFSPDWILLAGYMAILSPKFIELFAGKIINIHPSLLPKFKGLNTHLRVIQSGENKHGATVHMVTSELDGGPIIAQSQIKVLPNDTIEELKSRVLKQEHILYPLVLESLIKNYLELRFSKVIWHKIPPIFDTEQKDIKVSICPYLKIENFC